MRFWATRLYAVEAQLQTPELKSVPAQAKMTIETATNNSSKPAPKWPGIDNSYLIFESDDFIVYLDSVLAIEWQTSDDYDKIGPKDSKKNNDILGRAATLECVPNEHHNRDVRIAFKRMVGEGIARSLDNDYESADNILKQARSYITDRNVEAARLWQLSTACLLGLTIGIVGLIFWTYRAGLIRAWGELVFFLVCSAGAGALGAILSMIFRMGNNFPTSEAPRRLHILEATARVLAGCLSGLLVAGSVNMGLILATFGDAGHLHVTMLVAAMASGASERWAPSLITQLSGSTGEKQLSKGGTK